MPPEGFPTVGLLFDQVSWATFAHFMNSIESFYDERHGVLKHPHASLQPLENDGMHMAVTVVHPDGSHNSPIAMRPATILYFLGRRGEDSCPICRQKRLDQEILPTPPEEKTG